MSPRRQIQRLAFPLFAILLLAACSPDSADEEELAFIVEQTLAVDAEATEAGDVSEPEATEIPEEAFLGDLQPLNPEQCEQLAAFMVNRLPVPPVEQKEIAVEHQGKSGGGCQAIAVGTGEVFPDMIVVEEATRGILGELGWTEDPTAPACLGVGGWGPGASSSCFTQDDAVCEMFVHVDPIDDALCSDDEPIVGCYERLAPEQILYTVEVTCARDTHPSARQLESDLIRIEFDPGATQASVQGEVAAGGIDHYVLSAMEGQEMTVNLLDRNNAVIATDTAVLVIWGGDGTVLISDHADARNWAGELPFTQDYFIDVKSVFDQPILYTLEIIIPPP